VPNDNIAKIALTTSSPRRPVSRNRPRKKSAANVARMNIGSVQTIEWTSTRSSPTAVNPAARIAAVADRPDARHANSPISAYVQGKNRNPHRPGRVIAIAAQQRIPAPEHQRIERRAVRQRHLFAVAVQHGQPVAELNLLGDEEIPA
jgi:hypothetical protein